MNRKSILVFLFFAISLTVYAQTKPYKIVFYNLENFFDTVNDPEVLDDEFTPEGPKKWTQDKYDKKLHNMERVFFDIAPANYRIVHHDSPEARGVDVAFFYRADVFKLEGEKAIRTIIPSLPNFKTRDILTMWGKIDGEDFLFMVGHWPSRLGGKEASEYKRIAVGEQMRSIADSVKQIRPDVKVVLMGDFNDDPTDPSITQGLGAKLKVKELQKGDYYAPYASMLKAGYGTLAYGDAWNIFDNIVVTENLVNDTTDKLKIQKAPGSKFYGNIFKRHYMVQKEGQYKGYPLRTYVGNNFQGGYSDHFPVYIYIGK